MCGEAASDRLSEVDPHYETAEQAPLASLSHLLYSSRQDICGSAPFSFNKLLLAHVTPYVVYSCCLVKPSVLT